MTPHFFSTKPTEELIEDGVKAEYLNDDALSRALDCIADYGVTKFYATLALDIGIEHNLIGKTARLDSTTFVFHGDYEGDTIEIKENINIENSVEIQNNLDKKSESIKIKQEEMIAEEKLEVIELNYGYSKDHRPDLKQATFSIATTGVGSYPFWCEPQNGNSSDKSAFQESIKKYHELKKQMKAAPDFTWVADSALYNGKKLLGKNAGQFKWITRVPESIKEAKNLVKTKNSELNLIDIGNGYSLHSCLSNYGDIEQRWLLIFSEQAAYREIKTLERKIEKAMKAHHKAILSLNKKKFESEKEAIDAAGKLIKKLFYFTGTYEIEIVEKNEKKGRPLQNAAKIISFYKILVKIEKNEIKINEEKLTKGRFILATNQMNEEELTNIQIFEEYKSLQNTERGFRFFKDPWFLAKQFFLKTPSRIAALMSIMSLSLLVYTAAEIKIRAALKEEKETIPDQNKRPIQRPTLRFIFQLFSSVTKITIKSKNEVVGLKKDCSELKTNPPNYIFIKLTDVQRKIIRLFGGEIEKIYFSDG